MIIVDEIIEEAQTEMTAALDGVMGVLKQMDGITCNVSISDLDKVANVLFNAAIRIKARLHLVDTVVAKSMETPE